MTTAALSSQGVKLQRGDAASPEVFTNIVELDNISAFSGSTSVIDASSLDDTYVQKLMGLIDEGQVTFTGNYLADDLQHQGLRTDRTNKTLRNFRLLTDTASPIDGYTFSAYVTTVSPDFAVNTQRRVSVTLEISGAVTAL